MMLLHIPGMYSTVCSMPGESRRVGGVIGDGWWDSIYPKPRVGESVWVETTATVSTVSIYLLYEMG